MEASAWMRKIDTHSNIVSPVFSTITDCGDAVIKNVLFSIKAKKIQSDFNWTGATYFIKEH